MINILENIKKYFRKRETNLPDENMFLEEPINYKIECNQCKLKKQCQNKNQIGCEFLIDLPRNFDKNKKTALIIDDSEGMVSFLQDDFNFFDEHNIVSLNDINLLCISGSHAAFNYEALENKIDLNIHWAIIDITLGGSINRDGKNIKYTGVDVYRILKENNDFKYIFYTGNNLNPYLKYNKKIIKQFKDLSGEDIMDNILMKTSLDMDSRRSVILDRLFGIKMSENTLKELEENSL